MTNLVNANGRSHVGVGSIVIAFLVHLACLLSMRCAYSETIPLVRQGGTYLLPVRINDAITLEFLLDTGATDVTIPADVFLTLTRTGTVRTSDLIGSGTYALADGSKQRTDRFLLRELRMGDHIIRNVVASVQPASSDYPLLGQSFLAKLPTWTIDNERHVLVLNDNPSSVSGKQTASVKPPAPADVPPTGSAAEQFNYAFGLLKKADYSAAEGALKSFLRQHPDDPLAGIAQYWLGETYYARERFGEAANAFAESYKRYPNGAKAADDLLKLGMSLGRANQRQNACVALTQLELAFSNPGATIKERADVERKRLGC